MRKSKVKRMIKPDGIIVTMPVAFFKEYGAKRFEKEIERLNDFNTEYVWYRVMKNLPTIDVLYCYLLYNGKIQWRVNIAGYERGVTKAFPRPKGGVRVFENCNMVTLCGPAIKCPKNIPMKGFQGFRYTQELFSG